MPFPKLQKMPVAFSTGSTFVSERIFDDDGFSSVVDKDLHQELPPAEYNDLAYMIKNKIPLQEVNSKILGGNTLKINVKAPDNSSESSNNDTTYNDNKGE